MYNYSDTSNFCWVMPCCKKLICRPSWFMIIPRLGKIDDWGIKLPLTNQKQTTMESKWCKEAG